MEIRVICSGLLFTLLFADALRSGVYFPQCRDAMPRVFSPTGIYLKFTPLRSVLNQDLQDFQDYRERLRFGGKGYL